MHFHPAQNNMLRTMTDKLLSEPLPEETRFTNLFTTMTYAQGQLLSILLRERIGMQVYQGPFQGMNLIHEALTGHYAPALLGIYERELHDVVEKIIAHPYKQILNIGCCYGYYAVGLARRMPNTKIYAYDIDPEAREKCTKMIAANNVADRITVHGEFPATDFATFANDETLVIMDIEGAEKDLLDPALYPALLKMDVLLEMHDTIDASLSTIMPQRFAATHDVVCIKNKSQPFPLEDIFGESAVFHHLDRMIVTSENRAGPTPWAFMTRKKG